MQPQGPPVLDRQARTGPFFLVPYFQNPNFVGQNIVLHRLREMLNPSIESYNQVALYGLGGVGKTQIALVHAYWQQFKLPKNSTFWIQANDTDQLLNSIGMIAAHCKISRPEDTTATMLERMRGWLSDRSNGHWLIIVDSADNPETFYRPPSSKILADRSQHAASHPSSIGLHHYIPRPPHGKLLLTTNNKSAAEQLIQPGHVLQVQSMDQANARALLRQRLPEQDQPGSDLGRRAKVWLNDDLEKLAQKLDYLPLALAQAASFMREESMSVGQYLELIDNDDSRLTGLLTYESKSDGRSDDLSKAILSTWNVGFDRIEAQCRQAADLLSLMAFYNEQGIPKSLLRHIHIDEWQLDQQALNTLLAYSFITNGANSETFGMHRLIQLAMRERLSVYKTERKWAVQALTLLSDHFPNGEYESWESCVLLIPHALKILRCDLYGPDEAIVLGILEGKLCHYYVRRGLFHEAETWSRKALESMTAAPSATREHVWAVKSSRILVMKDLGRFEDAEDLAQEVWRERSTVLGPKHEDTLQSMVTLTLVYQEQGRYIEGAKAIRKVLKILERTLGEDHIQTLAARLRLSSILQFLGHYIEAEKHIRDAIEGYERILGRHHPRTLKAHWCLARILHGQCRYVQAEAINLENWTLLNEVLGPDHPDTIKSRFGYSNDLQAQRKFAAAEYHKREIYGKAVQLVGLKNNYSLIAASSLASCLVASSLTASTPNPEKLAEAEHLYHMALDCREKLLRIDHPVTLAARTDLAVVKRLRGQILPRELETAERENLGKLKISLGNEHPLTLRSRDNLARILRVQGADKEKQKEALKIARRVFEISKRRLGWDKEQTWTAAEFVLEMLPEGREKVYLAGKIVHKKTV